MSEATEQFERVTEQDVMRRWDRGEKPMTTAEVCEFLSLRAVNAFEAISRIMRRDPSFPRPVTRGTGGNGWLFFRPEIEAWLHAQPRVDTVRTRARGVRS